MQAFKWYRREVRMCYTMSSDRRTQICWYHSDPKSNYRFHINIEYKCTLYFGTELYQFSRTCKDRRGDK